MIKCFVYFFCFYSFADNNTMTYDWYLDGKKRETLKSYRYLEEIDCFQYYFCAKNACGVVLYVPYSCWSSNIKAKKKEEPSSCLMAMLINVQLLLKANQTATILGFLYDWKITSVGN